MFGAVQLKSAEDGDINPLAKDSKGSGPKRKANVEIMYCAMFGSASYDGSQRRMIYGTEVGGDGFSTSASGYAFGLGAHIPVYRLSNKTTIWLVPTFTFGGYFEDVHKRIEHPYEEDPSGSSLNVEFQLHGTYGLAFWQKRQTQFEIEGGLGLTYRMYGYGSVSEEYNGVMEDSGRLLPTTQVELSFKVTNSVVYRLRFKTDIFESQLNGGVTARQMNLALVIGY